jgi:hypothetical protein
MASCNLTTGFPLDCTNNAGGISEIYIASFAQKGNLTIVSGSVTNTGSFLQTASGAQFYKYIPRKQTADATSDMKVSQANGSMFYEQAVNFTLAKTDVQKRNEVALLGQQSVFIIIKDKTNFTGSYWLYGSDAGMELSATQTTGKAYGDLNGYSFKMTGPGETYDIVAVPASLIATLQTPA